jgi:hypothetical protein
MGGFGVVFSADQRATLNSSQAPDDETRDCRLSEIGMIKTALELPSRPKPWAKVWAGLSVNRPTLYISVVLVAALVSYAHWLRAYSIFSCQADGYSSDRYLAYCGGEHYADYEHGAFWFDLEPPARIFARNADVLFIGNSRIQVALSTAETDNWFAAASARYYLLGFSYSTNVIFTDKLLRMIRPRARVYVINVDDFFERYETPPVKTIFHDPEARSRYEDKRSWQRIHEPICKTFAALCGVNPVTYRSRETGAFTKRTSEPYLTPAPVSYDQDIDQQVVDGYTVAAIVFLSRLPVDRRCVILTNVPTVKTKIGNIETAATNLGMNLVAPEIPEGLRTYDGSHLDQPSAERWSRAFFQSVGSRIRSCLDGQGAVQP